MTSSPTLRPSTLRLLGHAVRAATPVPEDATTPQRHVDMLAVLATAEREQQEARVDQRRAGERMPRKSKLVQGEDGSLAASTPSGPGSSWK